jgi:hypothetical protein
MQGQVPRKSTGFEGCKAFECMDAPSHEPHAKRVSCFGVKMSQLRGGSASGRRFALALLLGWGVLAFGQGSDQEWLVRVGLERQASGKQIFVRVGRWGMPLGRYRHGSDSSPNRLRVGSGA